MTLEESMNLKLTNCVNDHCSISPPTLKLRGFFIQKQTHSLENYRDFSHVILKQKQVFSKHLNVFHVECTNQKSIIGNFLGFEHNTCT